jgi:hypothetical protein
MVNNGTLSESGFRNKQLGFDVRHPDFNAQNSYIEFREAVEETFSELEDLLLSKHKDYGPSNIAEAPGGAINGLRVRMHDKLARINNLYSNADNAPEHESFEDSFKDMANYAIIGLLVLRGKWPSK